MTPGLKLAPSHLLPYFTVGSCTAVLWHTYGAGAFVVCFAEPAKKETRALLQCSLDLSSELAVEKMPFLC